MNGSRKRVVTARLKAERQIAKLRQMRAKGVEWRKQP